jgi:signal transduction histidine kinase
MINSLKLIYRIPGKGIPAADMKAVFEPGFTTKGERMGIGAQFSETYY